MNIYLLKSHFDAHFKTGMSEFSAEPAWAVFKAAVRSGLDEDFSEELKFGFGAATLSEGFKVVSTENQFQIYFGRLIDAGPGQRWRSAEIDFYFRYDQTPELRSLLAEFTNPDFEVFYTKTDPQAGIDAKIAAFFAFADQQQAFWDAVRGLPVRASYSFWLI